MIRLKTPLKKEDVVKLKIGDRVFITGTLIGARDQAHKRLVKESSLPFDLTGAIIYYVGPTPARPGFPIGASGPTSAYRMDPYAPNLMARGVYGMIGKGNRGEAFKKSLEANGAVYFIATGGAGALLSTKIKSAQPILYEDLGTEAVYKITVEDFPCLVAYDAHGGDIFEGSK